MTILNNKNNILNIIRYGPILFVLVVSILTTLVFIQDKNEYLKNEIEKIENDYLDRNKTRAQEEIQRVYNLIKNEKENSEILLKENIKNRVNEAHNIASNIYIKESRPDDKGHFHSREHIFDTIKTALGGIIYNNGRGYIFIDDITGTKLLQPLNKEFEGKNLFEYEDAKGYKFVKKIVQTIKNKSEDYDSYYWFKGNNKEIPYKKISFYKYFEPFNIAIGTGEYVKDFEDELKENLLTQIKKIRYHNNQYIFIYDLKGNCLSHFNENLIGKNRLNVKSPTGKYVVQDILNFSKNNKEGFISYNSTINPNSNLNNNEKISYIKTFEDWGWVIGTGFYLDSLNEEIIEKQENLKNSNKEAIKNILVGSFLITIIFIFISFYISKIISKMFEGYEKNIKKQIEEKLEKEKMLIQQSKMATMGEMIGNIAHQWKQPLSLISTSNGLLKLQEEFNNFSKKDVNDAMEAIDNSVKNLSTTIDDFRNFFNPHKQKEFFKLSDSLDKTCKLISSQFKNNNIEVVKNIDDVELFTFENELLQTLINILKNAKEELEKLDSNQKRLLFIDSYKENDKIIIKIKDNAGGVPSEFIDNIFDNHFTTKEESGGSGIGLYMSKQIIEGNMNGKLSVINEEFSYENELYFGACFIIELPID